LDRPIGASGPIRFLLLRALALQRIGKERAGKRFRRETYDED
jgi:hypothetical protein